MLLRIVSEEFTPLEGESPAIVRFIAPRYSSPTFAFSSSSENTTSADFLTVLYFLFSGEFFLICEAFV
jgi:hypothetical protein